MEKLLLNNNDIAPTEYFDYIKSKKHTVDDELLSRIYENAEGLLQKAMRVKQYSFANKLIFHLETIEKERELVKLGINTFVYQDDIEEYIDNVANKTVKVIELSRYEREIPDDIADIVQKVDGIFDVLYVVFTDYTGKIEKQVEKERRDKDPILFGTFQSTAKSVLINRFYFLGDWVDEYCDLTLDKMVSEMKSIKNKDVIRNISTPLSLEEIKFQLNQLTPENDTYRLASRSDSLKTPTGFFNKVKTFLIRK